MSRGLDKQKLAAAFQSRPDIVEGIQKAAAETPAHVRLFNEIASFVCEQTAGDASSEPALKRRRVDVEPSQNGSSSGSASTDAASEKILLEIKDISISIPQRKKFDLVFTAQHIYARAPNTTTPVPGIVYAWRDLEYAFYLPVPEKSQAQFNYVLLPRGAALAALSKNAAPGDAPAEPLVFTVPAGAPKPGAIGGPNAGAAAAVSDTYSTLFHWAINKCLGSATEAAVQIEAADPAKFHSMVRQAHRPKEKAVHVAAHRGSKDGYLFFLENGILWGFKKPLLFIPVDRVAAVSYTNVLQRTFNVVIEVFSGGPGDEETTEEVEFSMLDQEDYAGINENYVMRKGLQDRSMADQRKAKQELAENAKGKKGAADANGDAQADEPRGVGLAELLEEEDDEDEEDYDPGSDGESEGSGSDDDDDDDDDEDDEDAGEMDEDEAGEDEEEE